MSTRFSYAYLGKPLYSDPNPVAPLAHAVYGKTRREIDRNVYAYAADGYCIEADLTKPFEIGCRFKLASSALPDPDNEDDAEYGLYVCGVGKGRSDPTKRAGFAITVKPGSISYYFLGNGSGSSYYIRKGDILTSEDGFSGLQADQWVFVKAIWTGSEAQFYASVGTLSKTVTDSRSSQLMPASPYDIVFGGSSGASVARTIGRGCWLDLDNCYFKQNGVLIWGHEPEAARTIYGKPVTLGGVGGVPVIARDDWEALTTAQKRAYELVAIQDYNTGFLRGDLVYGAEYASADIVQYGTGVTSASFEVDDSGTYQLFVIAMNSEATTYDLNLAVSVNGNPVTVTELGYNSYQSSSSAANRRNYRIVRVELEATAGDTVSITLTNYSNYSSLVWALMDTLFTTIDKQLSKADAVCSGTNDYNGMVLYGTFAGNSGGTINASLYTSGATITTANPGSSYKSAYIFWFV